LRLKAGKKSFVSYASGSMFWGRLNSSFILTVTAFFVLAASVLRPESLSNVRTGFSDAISPFVIAIGQPVQNAVNFVDSVSGVAELRAEVAQLRSENARLKEWYQTALMLQAENQSLQELLNLKVEPKHQYISARIISDAGNSFVKSVLVAAGTSDGVEKGQAALSGDGLIGRVVETGRNTSRILLLSDYNSRIPVFLEGSSQKAILAGQNTGTPHLKYLPEGSSIEEGTRVFTSGHGGLFPAGLPIGETALNAGGDIVIKPYADMSRVLFVRLVDIAENPNLRRNSLNMTQ